MRGTLGNVQSGGAEALERKQVLPEEKPDTEFVKKAAPGPALLGADMLFRHIIVASLCVPEDVLVARLGRN